MKVGYARVSSDDQNLDLQLDALNNVGCERIFRDEISGATINRPGLTDALQFLRAGDTLVIWKLDRLGRNTLQMLDLLHQFENQKILFSSLTEGIDTGTPGGKLIFTILSSFAQYEREILKERTRAGLTAARARGRYGGRPRKLSPQQEKGLAAMAANPEISIGEIAEAFGISRPSVYSYLKRLSSPPAPP